LGSREAKLDMASAPDDPNLDGAGWAREIMADDWLHDAQVDAFVGPGPVITDDRPISEYYLIRTLAAKDHAIATDQLLRGLTARWPSPLGGGT
jgi:hypothetical protein